MMFHLCNVVILLLDCFYFGYFVARMMQIWYLVMFPGCFFFFKRKKIRKGLFWGQPLIIFFHFFPPLILCNLAV